MWKKAVSALVLAGCATILLAAALPLMSKSTPVELTPPSSTRLVNVGGRHVALHVIPGRPPAVVFEAGGGMDSPTWNPVLSTIYSRTGAELITFDRAGFGDSDEDPEPVQLQREVDDLKAGLSALGATHGLILVAHSFGGEAATVFASENPNWVARAVLVDTNIPSFFTDDETAKVMAAGPKDVEQTDKQGRAMVGLIKAFPTMQHSFHAMHWPDAIPATVIVSEHPPLATPAENALWIEDHARFARGAANRSFIVAKNSGHFVMTDRPDLVSQAVVIAINQVRQTLPR